MNRDVHLSGLDTTKHRQSSITCKSNLLDVTSTELTFQRRNLSIRRKGAHTYSYKLASEPWKDIVHSRNISGIKIVNITEQNIISVLLRPLAIDNGSSVICKVKVSHFVCVFDLHCTV